MTPSVNQLLRTAIKSAKEDPAFTILLFLLATSGILLPWVGLLRQTGHMWVSHYWKVVDPVLWLALATFCALALRRLKIDVIAVLFLCLGCYGALRGLWMWHADTGGMYGARQAFSHVFVISFWFLIYVFVINYPLRAEKFDALMRPLAAATLASYGLALFVYYVFFPGGYLGLSISQILLVLAYATVARRPVLWVLAVTAIILSGKRGVLLMGLPCVVAAWYMLMQPANGRQFATGLLKTAAILAATAGYMIVLSHLVPGLGGSILNKWGAINDAVTEMQGKNGDLLAAGTDSLFWKVMGVATSGRFQEFQAAFGALSEKDAWLLGLGYGFGFEVIPPSRTYVLWNHYVHFTPMNFVLQYGLLIGIAFQIFVLARIIAAMRHIGQNSSQTQKVFACYLAGLLGLSLSAYGLSIDPIYWLLIAGILKQHEKDLGLRRDFTLWPWLETRRA